MEKFLDFDIEDKFKISAGLLLTGLIDVEHYGKIKTGNYIGFECDNISLKKKIVGVEMMRRGSLFSEVPKHFRQGVGLLIEYENEEELLKIMESKTIRQKAIIYKD